MVKENRSSFIWLTFVFGALVAKVFFNRRTPYRRTEIYGVIGFLIVSIILFFIGIILGDVIVPTWAQLLLLLFGGAYAFTFWPQYSYRDSVAFKNSENKKDSIK